MTICAPMMNRFEIWMKGIDDHDDEEEEESDLGADEGDQNGNEKKMNKVIMIDLQLPKYQF